MPDHPVVRVVSVAFKIIAALVLVATALTVSAIIGSAPSTPAAFPAWLVWSVTLGAAGLVAFTGLLISTMLYAFGSLFALLRAIEDHLRVASDRLHQP